MLNKYVGLSLILACVVLGVPWMCLSSMSVSFQHTSLVLAVNSLLPAGSSPCLFRCITDGKYQQAMGIAIECRRLDKLEEAITKSDNVQGTLSYCINVSHSFVNLREYRHEVSISIHLLIASLKVATLFSQSIYFCFFWQSE